MEHQQNDTRMEKHKYSKTNLSRLFVHNNFYTDLLGLNSNLRDNKSLKFILVINQLDAQNFVVQ
jgi:hypothetical protein